MTVRVDGGSPWLKDSEGIALVLPTKMSLKKSVRLHFIGLLIHCPREYSQGKHR